MAWQPPTEPAPGATPTPPTPPGAMPTPPPPSPAVQVTPTPVYSAPPVSMPAPPPAAALPANPTAGQLSPDGGSMWNGSRWISAISPDGRFHWNGKAWVPAVPGAGATSFTPSAPAAPSTPSLGAAMAGAGIGYQFGGSAAFSIGFGLAAILAPIFTNFYFPILPLFGIWRGVVAIRSGRLIGGIIGLVLNVLGGLVSLFASGLLGSGG